MYTTRGGQTHEKHKHTILSSGSYWCLDLDISLIRRWRDQSWRNNGVQRQGHKANIRYGDITAGWGRRSVKLALSSEFWRLDGASTSIVSPTPVASFPADRQPWQQPRLRPAWIWRREFGSGTPTRLLANRQKMNTHLFCQPFAQGHLYYCGDVMRVPYEAGVSAVTPLFLSCLHITQDWRLVLYVERHLDLFSLLFPLKYLFWIELQAITHCEK